MLNEQWKAIINGKEIKSVVVNQVGREKCNSWWTPVK